MKPFGLMIAALGLLFFAGQGLVAQEGTAPPPPPAPGTTPPAGETAPPPPPKAGTAPTRGETAPPPPPDGTAPAQNKAASLPRASAPRASAPGAIAAAPTAAAPVAKAPAPAPAPRVRAAPRERAAPKKGLYGGLMGGLNMPWYAAAGPLDGGDIESKATGEFGGFIGWHLGKVGIQLEVLMAFDDAIFEDATYFTATSLLLPLIAKYDINLGSFVIQPLIGPYYNFALGDLHVEIEGFGSGNAPYGNPPLGIMVGSALGWKFSKGMLFLDARFAFDLGKTVFAPYGEDEKLWQKSAFILSLGYQFN